MTNFKLPCQVFPSRDAEDRGWDERDQYYWPGKAVHQGMTHNGKFVVQFLIRQRSDGFLKLKTWQSTMLVPFVEEVSDVEGE